MDSEFNFPRNHNTMDAEFFKQLEDSFSNIGSDECWKKEIGGRTIWFSPISFSGQAKVHEALLNKDLGENAINESKRVSLAHSIVGIDNIDLRAYRNAGNIFGPVPDSRDPKKKIMFDLPGYVCSRMTTWGSQWIDDAFDILADLMESHQKKNVASVKFENSKNPIEELGELMVRVTELRLHLGLPPLIESTPVSDEVQAYKQSISQEAKDRADFLESKKPVKAPDPEESEDSDESFDPFKAIQTQTPLSPKTPPLKISHPSEPSGNLHIQNPERPVPSAPVIDVPSPVQAQPRSSGIPPKPSASFDESGQTQSSPQTPFLATPSVPQEVVEQSTPTTQVAPPVIDPILTGRNPRFHSPTGG